ncbi:hypothetical protein J53TS2_38720 [Paenibacillus sp. J53TS2]|uniref:S-layer homology domain-containing protein n=1 Tax=Paenibacillus sp. J53TS2 TaxID=2807197 RepID=UPI001B1A8F89|nr:S-layer homology domain-containing protein [Paenibacillus sp. J53TS2]GIP50281.1 hypothetical protein J53TS2_38720 [Paenibacillus sp. J53TS2]
MKRLFSSLIIFTMFSMFFSSGDINVAASTGEDPRFEAIHITDTTATLEWDPIDGAVSYSLQINGTALFDFTPNKFRHDVTGLNPNLAQTAILFYKDADGGTFQLEEYEFTTEPLIIAPPTNLRVLNVTTNSAEIHWVGHPYAIEYYISVDGVYAGRAESSPYLMNDLTANTTYNVEVVASNLLQNSPAAEIEFTTGSSWPDASVVNLRAEAVTATTATLVWNEIPTATEYHLSDGEDFEQSVTAVTYGLTGLSPNTSYTFSLIASNSIESSSEYTYTFTTAPATPAAPTGLTATAGDAKVSLAWNSVTGAGSYNVKRSTTLGGSYTTIAANIAATTYTDTTAANGTTYYYVVNAVNPGLESTNSNEVSARPAATVVGPTQPGSKDDSSNPSGENNSPVLIPKPPGVEDGSTKRTDDNNSTVILKVTSTIEQTADGKSVSKITVDPVDLQKAMDAMKSASGTPKVVIQVPGNTESTNFQLNATVVAGIQAQVPSAVISVQSDSVTYDLPAEVLDIPAIAKNMGAEAEDLNINITIDKVTGATAAEIERAAKQSGLQPISDPVDFNVTVESPTTGQSTSINDFGNTYVTRTIHLAPTSNNATGVLYNPGTGAFSFVPATFETNNGKTVATLKRNGNSIYAVIEYTKTFDDLSGHWAKADVELLASKLVVEGVSDDRFAPESQITRAEFASLLVRAMGISEDNTSKFLDVKPSDWFAGAVNAAAKAGFVDGFEDGTFKPNANITREEMAVMIAHAMSFAGQQPAADVKSCPYLLTVHSSAVGLQMPSLNL